MVNIYVMDKEFQTVGVIDVYESLLWTDRFYTYGDFELYTAFDPKIVDICKQDYFMYINESPHLMVIESINVESDVEKGNNLKITGRSLESMIDRRIVWEQIVIPNKKPFHTFVKEMLEDNIIDPWPYNGNRNNKRRNTSQQKISDDRKIENFYYVDTTDPAIIGLTLVETYYFGENLYDLFTTLFEDNFNKTIGYKILLDENNRFRFELYTGVDRSYEQGDGYVKTQDTVKCAQKTYYEKVSEGVYVLTSDTKFKKKKKYYEKVEILPFVVFSPQFDNVVNSNYLDSIQDMKNVALVAEPEPTQTPEGGGGEEGEVPEGALVAGDEVHLPRETLIVGKGHGIDRRELFSDASDLQKADFEDDDDYKIALQDRGKDDLHEHKRVTSYEGEVEASRQFVYNKDFFMGDIVQMSNEYGMGGKARVVEWVLSIDKDGITSYPTFDAVQIIDDDAEEEDNS